MIDLGNLLRDEPFWQRPIPICGSVYSKMILAVSLYPIDSFLTGTPQHQPDIGVVMVAVIIFAVGGALFTFEIYSIKRQRNNAANALYRIIVESLITKNEAPTNFSLYLRRFGSEEKQPSLLGLPAIHPVLIDLRLLPNTFEAFLSDQMYGWCPLVGLGRLEETVGAGKILSEDPEWQTRIHTLLQNAKMIFLVPATTKGIIWEVREVLKDRALLSKTIVLIPPATYRDYKGEWDDVREAYVRDFGCTLPEYNAKGLAFKLSNELKPEKLCFIGAKGKKSQIRKTLLELGTPE